MEYYPTLVTLHIIFAGGWLISFINDSVLKRLITKNSNLSNTKTFINLYLIFTNQLGIIGASGILLTGIIMVIMNPGYGFFDMSANHWLATKQMLMVVLLIIIFAFIIPTAKKIRSEINSEMEKQNQLSDNTVKHLKKLFTLNMIVNVIVLLNFLFAITHRFIG